MVVGFLDILGIGITKHIMAMLKRIADNLDTLVFVETWSGCFGQVATVHGKFNHR